MQFSKIQLFALLAIGAVATPVDGNAANLQAREEHLLVARNCAAKTTQKECERLFSGCEWLHASMICQPK
ncbi:hypothetical protein PspLS_07067 [Pyricularia sp. CBS 133598]|nr:hypothetical protein PspLS_07067 [Pyricularia sp. CBS 133598]